MFRPLPVLVSDRVGAGADLVREGETGQTFAHSDVQSLSRQLEALFSNPKEAQRMGDAARRRIAEWGFPECEAGLRRALAYLRER